MNMKVGTTGYPKMTRTRTVEKCGNRKRTRIELRYADGTLAGAISITEPIKKKTKKLQYNFKEISTRIMQTKTSGDASRVLTSARAKVAMLARKLKSGEYDEKEVQNAIMHAEAIARVARKRMKHLREEENSKKSGGTCEAELEEKQDGEVLAELAAEGETEGTGKSSREEVQKLKREYQKLKREYQKLMRETQKELEESIRDTDGMEELSEELAVAAADNMDPADLEMMKKKHRAKEMREIMEADMKYLKALFDQLAKEKQEIASGGAGSMSDGGSGNPVDSGVALELGGADVPVQMPAADVAAMAEGGSIDVTV